MIGGECRIRTHGASTGTDAFKAPAIDHSANSPCSGSGAWDRTKDQSGNSDYSTAELLQNLGCGRENRTPSHLAYETSVTPCEPATENEYYLIKYKVYRYAWRGWQDSNLRTHCIGSDQPVPLCQLSYIHKEDDCFHPDGSYRE